MASIDTDDLQLAVTATMNHFKHPQDRQMAGVILHELQKQLVQQLERKKLIANSAQIIQFPNQNPLN
tara:strand:+ start:438 stop:638 length:201 start_codon:yes stop_codon:yes gene_type:complete